MQISQMVQIMKNNFKFLLIIFTNIQIFAHFSKGLIENQKVIYIWFVDEKSKQHFNSSQNVSHQACN